MQGHPALGPLDEAADAIARLTLYESKAELRDAIRVTLRAVDASLRILLRSEEGSDGVVETVATSQDTSREQVVEALLRRRRISLELAQAVTELSQLAERVAVEPLRGADAVVAVEAVALLRDDIAEPRTLAGWDASGAAPPPDPAAEGGGGAPAGVGAVGARAERAASPAAEAPPASEQGLSAVTAGRPVARSPLRAVLLGLLLIALAGGAVWIARATTRPFDEAVRAFTQGRWQAAEPMFRQIVADEPANVTAMLYLARTHRRQGRTEDAAEVLRRAVEIAGDDPDVRRELGHLFIQLGRPGSAAEQYRIAVDAEPEEVMNWIGLVHALRRAGDHRAETVLREAPAEVRAAMSR